MIKNQEFTNLELEFADLEFGPRKNEQGFKLHQCQQRLASKGFHCNSG